MRYRVTLIGGSYAEYELRLFPSPGTAELRRRDAGEARALRVTYTPLMAIKQYPAIHRGNETNHVEMTCATDVITIWVNGQNIIAARDVTYKEGAFVLTLAAESAVRAEAQIDNLVITQR